MARIDLHIPITGTTRYEQNGKRIVAYVNFKGNKRIYNVFYYDEAYDRVARTTGVCCQAPTFASTEAGALRQINKFFNS